MTLTPFNTLLLSLSLVASASALANPPGGKPPQEAIEACASSSENSQVSFETPRGDTLEATCKMIEGELVAVPDNAPDDMKQPPKKRS
ncbi:MULTISPECIES: hypothetical protein [Shewanella]|jgi:hypothetical protein|uniref:hypothetical protein n=1 Tax=Shewanella TaxID=22 RepID=UPI00200EF50B|nr:hypothetical protein [Shewanella basaltis]MCL1113139.1 hypothetical protein [Shewanella basaltis]